MRNVSKIICKGDSFIIVEIWSHSSLLLQVGYDLITCGLACNKLIWNHWKACS